MALNSKKPEEYTWGFKPPEDLNLALSKKIQYAIYDNRDGTIFGRTPKSWLKLITFYILFYIVLAILFAICMQGLLMSVSRQYPTWILDESLIGVNPGMGFRPMPMLAEEGSSVIWYQSHNKTNVDLWINTLDKFLEPYMQAPGKSKRVFCDYNKLPGEGKVCDIEITGEAWGPCRKINSYAFTNKSLCVFLKLNRIYGWTPDYYDNVDELPAEMPTSLKNTVKEAALRGKEYLNAIWVSCNPQGPVDNETAGTFDFWPSPAFPGYYYPYKNQEGYLSPLVAVRFKNPEQGILVNIECRAWAKNILYQRQTGARDRMGSVQFEILRDP